MPTAMPIHPWNETKAATLASNLRHLPHAQLFDGPKGLGKNVFATWLAQLLLCEHPAKEGHYCGNCQGCRLLAAGTHPDLHVIQPEAIYKTSSTLLSVYAARYAPPEKSKDSKDSSVIRIDQVRSLIESAQTRPQIGTCKVVILSPADLLNVNAANSLLKLLEEPPPDSYLILVADRPARLPATIRSRCTRLEFHTPSMNDALTWLQSRKLSGDNARLLLQLASGAPLTAFALAESNFLEQRAVMLDGMEKLAAGQTDPMACASQWKSLGTERCLLWIQCWLSDLIVFAMAAGSARLFNPDLSRRLQALEKRLDLKQLFEFSKRVARNRSLLGGPLDEQLLLEDLLIIWTNLHRH